MPKVNKQMPPPRAGASPARNQIQTYKSEGNLFDDSVPVGELPEKGLKFLIFGMSGTGKTTLACTFPTPLLLVRPEEVEDGELSVTNVPGVKATPNMTNPDQLSEVCEGQLRTNRYKTIVLDGATRLQDLVVKKHMGLQNVPVQMTWGIVPQADWNRIGITIKEYLRDLFKLCEMGTNVVIVAGERSVGDDNQSSVMVPSIMAAMTPGTTGWLHEVCSYNVHTFKREQTGKKILKIGGKPIETEAPTGKIEFCLHVGPVPLYGTKFRVPRGTPLPDVMVDPSYDKLIALIRGRRNDG
jgi:hypothetical protein